MIGCFHIPLLSKDFVCCDAEAYETVKGESSSGPCFLAYGVSETHPLKGTGRNEDAFFVSKHMIGVADGVGGIADEVPGIDPSELPNELMERCKDMTFLRQIDPEQFEGETEEFLAEHELDDYDEDQWTSYVLMRSWLDCQHWGATTALVVAIEDGVVTASQYGDSCFMHLRKRGKRWEVIYRSPPQTHSFLCPYQLSRKPLKGMNDYKKADLHWKPDLFFSAPKRKVKFGDLIIAGSDGLFDQLYESEMLDIIASHATISSESAEELANELFTAAQDAAGSKTKKTPYADAAEATYKQWGEGACGGRPDDCTVVVAFVGDDADDNEFLLE